MKFIRALVLVLVLVLPCSAADVTTTAILTFTNAAGTTNGNSFRIFHRSDAAGYNYTFTNRSPVGFHYITSTNPAAKAATNTYTKLTNDWRGKLRVAYESATALRIQSFVNEGLAITISTNWATLSLTTNVAGYAGTTQPGSNVAAYAFTLWNSTPPRTIQDWNQTGIHGAATNAIGEVYTNNALLLSGANSIRFVDAPNTVVTSSFSGTEAIIGFIATGGGGGGAQTNISVAGVTNAGTLAYSNATTFLTFVKTGSNTWNGTFIGNGAGLSNILRSGVTGLEAALSYLTSSISGGGNFIEDNSGNGTNTTDWGSLTVKQSLTVAADSGFTSAARAFANAGSGAADNFVAGSSDNTVTASSDRNAVVAGSQNSVSTNSDNNGIVAGQLNQVGTGVNDRGQYSGVFAGYNNVVSKIGGTSLRSGIFAGLDNILRADNSGIFSGQQNTMGDEDGSAIIAGRENFMDSGAGGNIILGGYRNRVLGTANTVGGGYFNLISAAGQNCFTAGYSNVIAAPYVAVFGRDARASNQGCFVFSDSTHPGVPFYTVSNNTAIFMVSGGMGIKTNNPGTNGLKVVGNVDSTVGFSINGVPFTPASMPRVLFASTNQVVALGSNETNLFTTTIAANTLVNPYETLEFTASGVVATDSGMAVYLGDSRLFTNTITASGYWMLRGEIMVGTANSVWSDIRCTTLSNSTNGVMEFSLPVGLATNNVLRITGTGHNNVTIYRAKGRWVPAP